MGSMANPEHLAILKNDVEECNAWRRRVVFQPIPASNPSAPYASIGPDLSGANFAKAKLQKINLSHTNLSGANLEEADLQEATFSLATLNGATVRGRC